MLEPTPDDRAITERLVSRVPSMLARAAVLRGEAADPLVQLAALAPRWLSGMTAVAVLVTAAALFWPSPTQPATGLEGFVVSGSAAQDDDPVLRALTR